MLDVMKGRAPGIFCATAVAMLIAAGFSAPALAAPNATYAHKMEMGQLLYFNGDVDRAIAAYEAAAELAPNAFEPHLNLLQMYVQKGTDEAMEKAAHECNEVLKRKPGNREVHFLLANILRTQA